MDSLSRKKNIPNNSVSRITDLRAPKDIPPQSPKNFFPPVVNELPIHHHSRIFQNVSQEEIRHGDRAINKEKPGKKTRSIISVALFLMVAVFAGIIGWYEFKNNDNSLDKMLARYKTAEKTTTLEKQSATTSPAAKPTVQPETQAAQPDQISQNSENLGTQATEPQQLSEEGDKKTFKNNEISFDYPEGYKVEDNGGQVIATKNDTMWRMKVYDNKDKKEIKAWFDGYFSGKDISDCLESDPATLMIGGLATKQMKPSAEGKKCEGEGFYALNSDKTKVVRIRLDKADETEANKILGTFKFEK